MFKKTFTHPHLKIIIIEDALSGNVPRVKLLKEDNMRFILGIKPGDHSLFFERMDEEKLSGKFIEHEIIDNDGTQFSYSFINNIVLKEDSPEIELEFI